MNYFKNKRKLYEIINHRMTQYEKALDGIISGKIPPEYARQRWQKLKEVKHG